MWNALLYNCEIIPHNLLSYLPLMCVNIVAPIHPPLFHLGLVSR